LNRILQLFSVMFLFSIICHAQSSYQDDFIFKPDKIKHGHTHASSVVECADGSLLACWYEGVTDKSEDVHIQAARLQKGAKIWSKSFLLADTPTLSDNNPCLLIDGDKRLWLFYYTLLGSPEEAWHTAYIRFKISTNYMNRSRPIRWDIEQDLPVKPPGLQDAVRKFCDTAAKSSDPRLLELCEISKTKLKSQLSRKLGWTIRSRPLILSSGEILLPMASEIFKVPLMAITDDGGKTWAFSNIPDGYGVIQPSVIERKDGSLLAFMRDTTPTHRIRMSESFDRGRNWTSIEETGLPNPGAAVEALTLKSGNVILIYNNTTEGARNSLAISLSDDDGSTWKWTRHLERNDGEGRYDYPSAIQTRDGKIHVTYSYDVKTIKHVVFSEQWIKGGE